jgi:CheY-like chemotaxis protein
MRTIIIADDDDRILELLHFVLEGQGCRVVLCHNGHEVLNVLETQPIDMIFMDILMPKLNGFETFPKIRSMEQGKFIPIILVTGVYDYKQIKRAIDTEDRNFHILFKPVSIKRIQDFMIRHFGEARNVQYIFPNSLKSRPSFKKRLTVDLSPSESLDRYEHQYSFVPRHGNLMEVRPGQILHFALKFGEQWVLQSESETLVTRLLINDGSITGFWSSNEDHIREMTCWEKLPVLNRFFKQMDTSNPHEWISGTSSSPLTLFLYDMLVSATGQYFLKDSDTKTDSFKSIKPFHIKDVINQFIHGEFSDALVSSIVHPQTEKILLSENFNLLRTDFEWSDDHLALVKDIEKYPQFRDLLSKTNFDRTTVFQLVTGLYLLGGVDIISRRTFKPKKQRIPDRQTAKSTVSSKSSPAIPFKIKERFASGNKGFYYEFLGVSGDISDNDLLSAIQSMETQLTQLTAAKGLGPEEIQQLKTLPSFLKEANSLLTGRSSRAEYDELLKLTDVTARSDAAGQQADKGRNLIAEGKMIKGITRVKLSLLMDPKHEGIHELYLDTISQFPEYLPVVIKQCRISLKLFPSNMRFNLFLGDCYDRMGLQKQAISVYQSILEKDPSNLEAMQYLIQFPDQEKKIFGS